MLQKILPFPFDNFVTLLNKIKIPHEVVNGMKGPSDLTAICTLNDITPGSLIWFSPKNKDVRDVIAETTASFIVCADSVGLSPVDNKFIIKTANPRAFFASILAELVRIITPPASISEKAVVHNNAIIGKNVTIGANAVIGNCTIGDNVTIAPNVTVYDGCVIGNNVKIQANTVVGSDGFGYIREEDGTNFHFPHIGGVIIEDDVEIGSNVSIDKGSIGNTILRKGSKVDNLVHIAHNVDVGENTFVIASSMIAGSVKLGSNAWIAPCSCIKDGLTVGDNTTIGLGAVVIKDVPDNQIWTGFPAMSLRDLVDRNKKLDQILQSK